MNTMRIELLDPKAARLLKYLAELKLIGIKDTSKDAFQKILKQLRSKSKSIPSLDEITREVEIVRNKRYKK